MLEWISRFPGYDHVLGSIKTIVGNIILTGPVPRHVGLIMDGNRRYAKKEHIELREGHSLGFESMAKILELLYESGVECASVYAFLIENFKRLSYEVEWLMQLAKDKFTQISNQGELAEEYGIKIKILGNVKLLPKDVQDVLHQSEEMTKHNTRAVLNVCIPYTSRDEITHLIQQIVAHENDDDEDEDDFFIDESTISNYLYTNESPPLDLLVRTSGTFRLSDFLLWQCVDPHCAIVFVDKMWPAFTPFDMCKILINWGFNNYWYGHSSGFVRRKQVKDTV